MRTRHSLPVALLYILSALLLLTTTARADDDTNNNEDEYEEHARVLRVSLLKGEVSLKRAAGIEWETARLNTPLVEGDTLATGRDARLEIQADTRNFVRNSPGIALAGAAVVGFVVARLLKTGLAANAEDSDA